MKIAGPLEKPTALKEQAIQIPGQPKPLKIAYAEWQPEDAYRGSVIAVHGLTRQKRDFDFVAATLCKNGYQVLAVDMPGRGGSAWLADPALYNLDVYADACIAFMKAMSLSRAHWIGTSMGGLIAMRVAEKGKAQMMRSLTLIDVTPKPNPAGLERIMGYVVEDLPVFQSPAQYLDLLKKSLPLGDMTPDYVWQQYADHQLVKTDKGYAFHFDPKIARRAQADFKAGVDLTEGMKKIDCPVALVAGGKSDICTAQEIADLKALHPGLALHMCPAAGHVPSLADTPTQQFIYKIISNA